MQRPRLPREHPTEEVDLAAAWEQSAGRWTAWARKPGHDSYWQGARDAFLPLLPPPGRRTLDLGCGEGRLSRDLRDLGHRVISVDRSPTMLRNAVEAAPGHPALLADAAALPLTDAACDLVVAFTSRHRPIEDYFTALEAAGFLVERLREIPGDDGRWLRLPLFLSLRAVKLGSQR